MNQEELVAIVRTEITNAESYSDGEINESRQEALAYYMQDAKARGDCAKGRSSVMSTDIADMVDNTLAQMTLAFEGDLIAQFEPYSEEDEDNADKETDFVSHVIMDDNPGYHILRDSCFDALLLKNGVIKVHWEEKSEVSFVDYKGLDPLQTQFLLQGGYGEPVDGEETPEGYNLTVKQITKEGKPRIEAVPPDELLVNKDHTNMDLQEARFVAHRLRPMRSTLVQMGFDKDTVDRLPTYTADSQDDQTNLHRQRDDTDPSAHKATERVLIHECYYFVDLDDDGIAERYKIVIGNRSELLEIKPCSYVPFTAGAALPIPHQFHGMSMFDKLKEISDTKTDLMRQMMDSGWMSINQRMKAVRGSVEEDSLLMNQAGGVVWCTDDLNAVEQLPPIPTHGTALELLGYMDKLRTERGGSALDMASENLPVAGGTAHGTERVMTSREQMVTYMTRNLAETLISGVYLLVHRMLRTYAQGPLHAKLGNTYAATVPQQWPERKRVAVTVGATEGERMRKLAATDAVINYSLQAMQAGANGIMVDWNTIYNAMKDRARYAGMDFPEQYWIDPSSPEAQQAMQQQQQAQQQQQQYQTWMFLQQIQTMIEAEKTKRLQLAAEQERATEDRMLEYDKLVNDYTHDMTKLELEYVADVPGSAV
jgi:hypothetical protein